MSLASALVVFLLAPKALPKPASLWHLKITARSVTVLHRADPPGSFGFLSAWTPTLILHCEGGKLTTGIAPRLIVAGKEVAARKGGSKQRVFTYRLRFDDEPSREATEPLADVVPEIMVGRSQDFIRDLLAHRTLAVTLPGSAAKDGGDQQVSFQLQDLSEVIAPLQAACPAGRTKPEPWRPVGRWIVEVGSDDVFVSQDSAVVWPSWTGKDKAPPRLILKCVGNDKKDAYIHYEHGFPGKGEADLFVSFPGEVRPKKYNGAPGVGGKAVFFTGKWSLGTAGLVKAMLEHDAMTVAVKLKGGAAAPPDASFDLAGLGAALQEWRQRCPIK